MNKEIITYKELSKPLKTLVWLGWIAQGLTLIPFIIGFIIGIIEGT